MKAFFLGLFLLFNISSYASTYELIKSGEELSIVDFNTLFKGALRATCPIQTLFEDVAIENECYKIEDMVVNCELTSEVKAINRVILEYLSGSDSIGTYRVYFHVLNQGTQMWNKAAIYLDFKFEKLTNSTFKLSIVRYSRI